MPDECPRCAPQTFERIRSVRDGQISMGWEYMPTKYKLKDGVYVASDELRQDTEDQLSKQPAEDVEAYELAAAQKRARSTGRPPLTDAQICDAIQWFHNVEEQALESRKSREDN